MTKYKNSYRVTFLIKKGGYKNYVLDIEAYNLKEAKNIAETMWYEHNDSHMFHIEVRPLRYDEEFLYNYFVRL